MQILWEIKMASKMDALLADLCFANWLKKLSKVDHF